MTMPILLKDIFFKTILMVPSKSMQSTGERLPSKTIMAQVDHMFLSERHIASFETQWGRFTIQEEVKNVLFAPLDNDPIPPPEVPTDTIS